MLELFVLDNYSLHMSQGRLLALLYINSHLAAYSVQSLNCTMISYLLIMFWGGAVA